jgi:LacI family transcriptional regulator
MLDVNLELVGPVRYGGWTETWGRAATNSLLGSGAEVDAILAGSDQIARGVLDALRDRGITVPDDVAVMGFDNWDPMVAGARPMLTSVDMNFKTIGRRAAQRLVDAIEGRSTAGVEQVECTVVVRGSTVKEA